VQQRDEEYTNMLTDVDRVKVRQRREGRRVLGFSVQYEALIKSRWRKIVRFDSADGSPHRHIFHAGGTEYRLQMFHSDNNDAFTEATTVVKRTFQQMRENYLIKAQKDGVL
jgi:hypothetical protein